jgi:hypothetical protein
MIAETLSIKIQNKTRKSMEKNVIGLMNIFLLFQKFLRLC